MIRKKCTPALLCASGSDKYEALLWIWRIIPLAECRRTSSGCVLQYFSRCTVSFAMFIVGLACHAAIALMAMSIVRSTALVSGHIAVVWNIWELQIDPVNVQ
eukprot:14437870-Ditylum_brightwellii.AAC.1